MICFSELTYSIYADGELSRDEAQRVEAHLSVCSRCRTLVDALRVEGRFLGEVLQATEEDRSAVAGSQRVVHSVLWGSFSIFAVAVGFVTAVTWLAKLFPSAADWLNPFNRTVLLNLLFRAIPYLAEEGATMLELILTAFSTLMLGLLIVGGVLLLLKRRRRGVSIALLAGLALALDLTQPLSAVEKRKGPTITIRSGETVDESLLASGESVNIDGTVNGNLFAFARRIVIKGDIKGDVFSFGQILDVDGTVEGSVYTWNQSVDVRGRVAHSVFVGAETLQLEPTGRVDADVLVGCGEMRLQGTVGRDVTAGCGSAEVRGEVGRNLRAYTDQLTLVAPGRVGGNLEARVDKKEHVQIEPGATVAGHTEVRLRAKRPSRYTRPGFYLWQGIQLMAALVTGLLLFWLFPALFGVRLGKAGSLLQATGVGFLVLAATPVAAIIAGITLIGLPIALLGLVVWVAGLYLAKIFVAALVGRVMMRPPVGQLRPFVPALLMGLVIVFVASNLPYLGGWVRLLVMLLGLGIGFNQVRSHWRRVQPAA